MLGWLVAVLAGLVALFLLLSGSSTPGAGDEAGYWIYVVVLSALGLLFLVSTAEDYRGRIGTAARHAGIWIGLGLLFIGGYAYRDEFKSVTSRIAGEILPGSAIAVDEGAAGQVAVRLRMRDDGQFVARVDVDGHGLNFMVDTGASTVVLTSGAAEQAGINVSALKFSVAVQTANGATFTAPVQIRSMSIGPIRLENVEALVAQPGNLKENLLGMSFLKRLRSYEASGDFLTLRG
jgi:aspartyl protease family protein